MSRGFGGTGIPKEELGSEHRLLTNYSSQLTAH
jgi:hypothetical protein